MNHIARQRNSLRNSKSRRRQIDPRQKQLFDSGPATALVGRHEAVEYPFYCSFGLARLQIDSGVFCPILTNVSPFLLEHVDFRPGERVLDAFAGCGAFGIHAALLGGSVVSVDVDPLATACNETNVLLNGVEGRVRIWCGTVEDHARSGERFDLIVANPPLLPSNEAGMLAKALYDPELMTTTDFIESLPRLLDASGRCYLVTSDVIDRYGYDIERICTKRGLLASTVAMTDVGYEQYRVHRIVVGPA